MSTPTSVEDCGRRAGFSLLEVLIAIAILALSTAIILPSTSHMLDQATAHSVFFDFQRQVSDLRREASRTGEGLRVLDPDAPDTQDAADRTLNLREPWRYTLAPALEIAPGGVCSATTANLVNGDRVVMTLRAAGGDCRFIRWQTEPGRPRGP